MIYESAQEFLKRKITSGDTVRLSTLRKEASAYEAQRIDLSTKLDTLRLEQKELEQAKKNVEIIMHQEQEDISEDKKKEQSIE